MGRERSGPRSKSSVLKLSSPFNVAQSSSALRLTAALFLHFLDPMVNATGPNAVPVATIPFRGNCQSFLSDPVIIVRPGSRCGNLSFSAARIFGDHSISFFGFGFCATMGYPAQHARLRLPADECCLR
jgi:hypothetical protein